MANVRIRELAKKELTASLPEDEAAVLYAVKNRGPWRQELMRMIEEEQTKKDELNAAYAEDVKHYEGLDVPVDYLITMAQQSYQSVIRKIDSFLYRAERRVLEIDRKEVEGTGDESHNGDQPKYEPQG